MGTADPGISRSIRDAGVVGAGGAGFPAHVKAEAEAELVIANGAECEPLLQKDKELLMGRADRLLRGMELMMRATGAAQGVVAVKAKHGDVVERYTGLLKGDTRIRLETLEDFYPAGDEFCLVYEVSGKLIPPGGIPLQVGTVVNNIETLCNVAVAADRPVTDTVFTVAGAVKRPCTLELPVGTSFSDAIAMAGGSAVRDFAVIDGGAMMGRVVTDMSEPVTKTTGGLIVLPREHPLVRRKSAPRDVFSRIGRSACDQCSYCTEFCPRYLLGYAIEPHKVMRSLSFSGDRNKVLSEWALLCCECSLCSLYACPESLDPKNVCVAAKSDLRGRGVGWKEAALNTDRPATAHPVREYRKVPVPRLMKRLGLDAYKADAPLIPCERPVSRVRIPLKQHLGAPAQATVKAGARVKRGQLIGEIPSGKLGARVHASMDGTVRAVDSAVTIEA